MTRTAAGGNIVVRPPGQPAVSELLSNKTVVVLPVNPQNTDPTLKDAQTLAAAAEAFRPELLVDLEQTSFNDADGGLVVQEKTPSRMCYGLTNPAGIINDFSLESLVGRVQANGDSKLSGHVLLRQRVQSLTISTLLERLKKDPQLANLLATKDAREKAVAALKDEIARIEKMLDEQRNQQMLKDADGAS